MDGRQGDYDVTSVLLVCAVVLFVVCLEVMFDGRDE